MHPTCKPLEGTGRGVALTLCVQYIELSIYQMVVRFHFVLRVTLGRLVHELSAQTVFEGVHPDRTPGRDRNYSGFDRVALTGRAGGARGSTSRPVHQQPETARAFGAQLSPAAELSAGLLHVSG